MCAEAQPPPIRVLPTRVGYDLWAGIYDVDANPLVKLEERYLWPALGAVNGLDVADVGCGTGRHALRLAQQGARVTAIDFSEGMLARARSKPGADRVTFVRADLAATLPLAGGSFDRVLCCLVVDHIADLAMLFAELGRICRADGSIFITTMHPAMMLKGVQARFTDPATGLETRPESVANRISDYVMAAVRAGLTIVEVGEYDVDETLVADTPRAAKHLGWPLLLTMRLVP